MDSDRDAHGPEFVKKMTQINQEGGFNISVYHSFHQEVNHFRTHWWQCDKCHFIIKRATNRAPGPSDWWFPRHQRECGGQYVKIRSPPDEKNKKRKRQGSSSDAEHEPSSKCPKIAPGTSPANRTTPPTILDKWLKSLETKLESKNVTPSLPPSTGNEAKATSSNSK